jgi:tetratricopeptide (TPR) repeat protein
MLKREPGAAGADLDRAVELEPERGMSAQGQTARAIEEYGEAIRLDPRHVEAWAQRGAERGRQGDAKGEMEDYAKGIEADPRHPMPYLYRGAALWGRAKREPAREREHLAAAESDFQRALEREAAADGRATAQRMLDRVRARQKELGPR